MRAVITHDFMETYGGAERLVAEIAAVFPDAPVVALLGRRSVAQRMGIADRFTSLLPPRERILDHYRLATPALPLIADKLRLPPADVIISSSYAFAHRLGARSGMPRVCYTHSLLRFAWSMEDDYGEQWGGPGLGGVAFRAFAALMRRSDRRSAQGVEQYVASGPYVAEQIREHYGREPIIIQPPVDCELFHPTDDPPQDYFLLCGRLIEPYKRVTIAVEAFSRLGLPLVVAGDGPERARLEAIAGPTIEFRGNVESPELVRLMQRCAALVFPSRDDFGMVPVEVMACGRPVIAFAGGGVLGTMRSGETGEFFERQTVDSLVAAVAEFDPHAYDTALIRRHAEQWDRSYFQEGIATVAEATAGAA